MLYITGTLNAVLGPEHHKEIIRYIYNQQVELFITQSLKIFHVKHKLGQIINI